MLNNDNTIPIDFLKENFKKFVEIKGNKRIFFSGKFGTGKTFFLKHFFKKNEEYDVYHLFPIRYQISSSENILELLKHDILVEFFKKERSTHAYKNKRDYLLSFKKFISFYKTCDLKPFAFSIVEAIPVLNKLGRPFSEILKLYEDFRELEKKIEKKINIEDKTSTDLISSFLNTKINKNKSVLILDDFDRIDPEHVFRILNALSIHNNEDEENKFGFKHIIIVGDIDNLESIFHHKYGEKTNFIGYFNKFFTIAPYFFDNTAAISKKIQKDLLCEIDFGKFTKLKEFNKDKSGFMVHFLTKILTDMVLINEIDLRQLYKPIKFSIIKSNKDRFQSIEGRHLKHLYSIDISIDILISSLSSKKRLLEVLEKIRTEPTDLIYRATLTSNCEEIIHVLKTSMSRPNNFIEEDTMIAESDYSHTGFYDTLIRYIKNNKHDKEDSEYNSC